VPLTELLGIELPIVQAPMAGAQGSALAIAVCEAGGLGSLPCAMLDPGAVREEVAAIRAGTRKPFNLNFFCHSPPEHDPRREAAWKAALSTYYDEWGIDAATPALAARRAFDGAAADLLEEVSPPVVSFHFGLPAPELMRRVQNVGCKVLGCATTVEEARWLEDQGVDAVIAQGLEAGGHRGMFLNEDVSTQVGLFSLLPQVVDAVSVPVVAAGGIADAKGVAAARALGAAGVQVGTAYLLCPEARTSAVHRAALTTDAGRRTALTNLISGRPARGVMNRLMRELGPMSALPPAFPLAASAVNPLRRAAEEEGVGDFSPLWAGQNTSGCREVPAAQITRELAAGL
jgi:nitronate monooxygenase